MSTEMSVQKWSISSSITVHIKQVNTEDKIDIDGMKPKNNDEAF